MFDEMTQYLDPCAASGNVTEDFPTEQITAALHFARTHLEMDAAYLSEFVRQTSVFQVVDAPGFESNLAPGLTTLLSPEDNALIVSGRMPEFLTNTADRTLAQFHAAPLDVPMNAHISIPIRRSNGAIYGMFCALNCAARPDLGPRDLAIMRAFAKTCSAQIDAYCCAHERTSHLTTSIKDLMDNKKFNLVYQPIVDAAQQKTRGFEALCRFKTDPYRPPNLWFDEAAEVGLQAQLECAVIREALQALTELPSDMYVSVNASPQALASGDLTALFAECPGERIVVEIKEHDKIADFDALLREIDLLRFRGVRIAIDDVSAGYSGLQHMVRLRPDIIKLDVSLTSNIDVDIVRRSLGSALVNFAREIDADIVAEGIETGAELETLQALGVPFAQGYFLSHPTPLQTARQALTQSQTVQHL